MVGEVLMKFFLLRPFLPFAPLVLCSRQAFKLQKLCLLFLGAFVITLFAHSVHAANQTPKDKCEPGLFEFQLNPPPAPKTSDNNESRQALPQLTLLIGYLFPLNPPPAPKTSDNNESRQPLPQLTLLTGYLKSQAREVRLNVKGGFGCAPYVFDNAFVLLGLPNQATTASPGVPYILLAVNLAFLLCISPLLTKQVRKNALSDQDLSAIKKVFLRSITNLTASVPIQPAKPPVNPDDNLIAKPSLLAELERHLATQARQISSLGQEIAEFRHEFSAATKPMLDTSNAIDVSKSLPSDAPPVPDLPSYEDPAESSDNLNDQSISIVSSYRNALNRGDRSLLRKIYTQQLVITDESEEALLNSFSSPTRLAAVGSGGSYLLVPSIDDIGRAWILPDWRTLESFTNNRPNKGIFSYRTEANLFLAELRQPAEVRQVGELWEVVTMGVIAVGG
jgi:hypothetical protein